VTQILKINRVYFKRKVFHFPGLKNSYSKQGGGYVGSRKKKE
jgi:hypothetical protein